MERTTRLRLTSGWQGGNRLFRIFQGIRRKKTGFRKKRMSQKGFIMGKKKRTYPSPSGKKRTREKKLRATPVRTRIHQEFRRFRERDFRLGREGKNSKVSAGAILFVK